MKTMVKWVKVFETPDVFKAELLKNELQTHEITAVVLNRKESNFHWGWCEVRVPDHQEAIAKVIIDIFNQNDSETKPTL
jgi:hypothetical protein